ncbi:MAG: hypothetical protein QF745_10670 [Planctomycetota bacterium]|jgi:hypothetical protein|nr:hypothetical protein [Planctomycetota bacterium]HJN13040.1 hypothetical protein [Pirellulaceae bacterium]
MGKKKPAGVPETYEWKDLLDPSGVVLEVEPAVSRPYGGSVKAILKYFAAIKKAAELAGNVKNPFVQIFAKYVETLMRAADAIVKAGDRIKKNSPGGIVKLTVAIPIVTRRVTIVRSGDKFEVIDEKVVSTRFRVKKTDGTFDISNIGTYVKMIEQYESNLQAYLKAPWKSPGKLIVAKKKEEEKDKEDEKQDPKKAALLEEHKRELVELRKNETEDKGKLEELNKTSKELNSKRPDQKKVIAEFDADVKKAEKVFKCKKGTLDGYKRSLKRAQEKLADAKKRKDAKDVKGWTPNVKWNTDMIAEYDEKVKKADQDLKEAKQRRKAKFTPAELNKARKKVQEAIKDTRTDLKEIQTRIREVERKMK